MSRILYISDTHFGHRNIIRYENRPFSSVQEMNEELIRRWNSVVTSEDTVVHGGDFALCNKEVATHICHSLNGYKILVKGNHDGNTKRMLDIGFDVVVENYFNDGILVNHYPDRVRQEYYDLCNIFLYGHVHSKIPHNKPSKGINISCEVLDYTPRTIEELLKKNEKELKK